MDRMLSKGEPCSCSGRPFAPLLLPRHAWRDVGHGAARGQGCHRHGRLGSVHVVHDAQDCMAFSGERICNRSISLQGRCTSAPAVCHIGNATLCRCPLHVVAGLHFGKQPSQQHLQGIQATPPLPLPALPHKTAWLLIGLQVLSLSSLRIALPLRSPLAVRLAA